MTRRLMIALALAIALALTSWGFVPAQSAGPLPTLVHVVQRGETLLAIAQRYDLTVDAVTHANGLSDPRDIYPGQRLAIPGERSEIDREATDPYVVQGGETLDVIARRYHTTWQTLIQLNGMLSPDSLHVGQVIRVPGFDLSSSETRAGLHLVRSGDTLFRLALRYGVSPWALAEKSQISNPALLYPGQLLSVPGGESGALPAPFASVDVRPLPVVQGKTVVVAVRTTKPVALEGQLFDRPLRFGEQDGVRYGLMGVHVFTEPGLYDLKITATDGDGQTTEVTADVVVEDERFGYERIDVSGSLLDPNIVAAEKDRLDEVRYTFSPERRWQDTFGKPCAGNVSSYFGSRRSYNGSPYTSYHSGVDFRAPGGTPVYAPAGATVVLVEPLTVRGNAVILDHGWGVLTGYWHLSSMAVEMGQQVAPGDVIGRVGNTGLSTGAHLHWETWVGGVSVDGTQWWESFYPWPPAESSEIAQLQHLHEN